MKSLKCIIDLQLNVNDMNYQLKLFWTLIHTLLILASGSTSYGINSIDSRIYHDSTNILTYTISFEESIPLAIEFPAKSIWNIYDENNFLLSNGSGNLILEYVFAVPGTYLVDIDIPKNETHEHGFVCEHQTYPESIRVNVMPVKIRFDFDELIINGDIVANNDNSNITLNVPVEIQTFNNQSYPVEFADVKVNGIKSNIIGKPVIQKIMTSSDKIMLNYQLSGIAAQKDAILMFDFSDTNGNIHMYTHHKPVK